MLEIITDYAVPAGVFSLMLIVGTEIVVGDFKRVAAYPGTVLLGVAGQLVVLPPLVLLIAKAASIGPSITAWLLLLSLCPGGAISNYYCYLARCNVPLAATITAIGTVCSLVSIPLWIAFASGSLNLGANIADVPALRIMSQLVIFMIAPMAIGITLFEGISGYDPQAGAAAAAAVPWACHGDSGFGNMDRPRGPRSACRRHRDRRIAVHLRRDASRPPAGIRHDAL